MKTGILILILVGVVAGGAWFLFFRKRPPSELARNIGAQLTFKPPPPPPPPPELAKHIGRIFGPLRGVI